MLERHKKIRHDIDSEEGFVLLWTVILLLPILTVAFIFLGYSQANLTKLKAQYHAMSLVAIGSYSSEFDTGETLNAMAALASALGFQGVRPNNQFQNTSGGKIHFLHDTDDAPHTLSALIAFEQDPMTSFVSQLGSLNVAGISSAKPGAYLISLVLDFSQSLNSDFKADDLLTAYGVVNPDGSVGPNGVVDPVTNMIMPDDVTNLALPFNFDIGTKIRLPYFHLGAQWPWPMNSIANCSITNESGCGGQRAPMVNDLRHHMSDNFLAYKKAAVILTGVAAQSTPYLTVDLLGGMAPQVYVDWLNDSMVGEPDVNGEYDSPYLPIENDGVYEIWDYHYPSVAGYEPNTLPPLEGHAGPAITTNIYEEHSFDNPKDPFKHNVNIDLRFPTYVALTTTGFRKLVKYGTFTDMDGKTHLPGTFSAFLDPPLPVLQNEKFNPPPDDSFVWEMGPLEGPQRHWGNGDLHFAYGYPTSPNLFSIEGPAHPDPDKLHRPIGDGITYPCEVGPPAANNAVWSNDKTKTGYALCKIRDYCDDLVTNGSVPCDEPSILTHRDRSMYFDRTKSVGEWPRCLDPGHVARCMLGSQLAPDSAVFCTFGDSAGHMVPRCTNKGVAQCINSTSNTPSVNPPQCRQFTDADGNSLPPRGHGNCQFSQPGLPCVSALEVNGGVGAEQLGTITLGADPPTVGSNLFYYLNDMGLLPPGTFTHNAVPTKQCQTFLEETEGQGVCAMVLVTDGRPMAVDGFGNLVLSDQEVMDEMERNMEQFTNSLGGKSFVWFLGSVSQWQSVVYAVQELEDDGLLSPAQQNAFSEVKEGNDICNTSHRDPWNSIPILGTWAECPTIDELTAIKTSEEEMLEDFRTVMDQPLSGRYWVETEVSNTAGGTSISGSLGSFLGGLKNLISILKRETRFDQ